MTPVEHAHRWGVAAVEMIVGPEKSLPGISLLTQCGQRLHNALINAGQQMAQGYSMSAACPSDLRAQTVPRARDT
jgi:hypothetical protein